MWTDSMFDKSWNEKKGPKLIRQFDYSVWRRCILAPGQWRLTFLVEGLNLTTFKLWGIEVSRKNNFNNFIDSRVDSFQQFI